MPQCKRCKKWKFFAHFEDGMCSDCFEIINTEEKLKILEEERIRKEEQEKVKEFNKNHPPLAERIAAASAEAEGRQVKIRKPVKDRTIEK